MQDETTAKPDTVRPILYRRLLPDGSYTEDYLDSLNKNMEDILTNRIRADGAIMDDTGEWKFLSLPHYHLLIIEEEESMPKESITGVPPMETGTVFEPPVPVGWRCPVCGRGNAPWLATCPCVSEYRTGQAGTGEHVHYEVK